MFLDCRNICGQQGWSFISSWLCTPSLWSCVIFRYSSIFAAFRRLLENHRILLTSKRNWVFATNTAFLNRIHLDSNVVDLRYFKLWISNNISLKYQRCTTLGSKDIGIMNWECVAKTFLSAFFLQLCKLKNWIFGTNKSNWI